MPSTIFPVRLSRQDRQKFQQAARAEKKSLSEWLRDAGRAHAANGKRRAACLDYVGVELPAEAERNPKAFIDAELRSKRKKALG